jgi:hypothetical protein
VIQGDIIDQEGKGQDPTAEKKTHVGVGGEGVTHQITVLTETHATKTVEIIEETPENPIKRLKLLRLE